MPPFEQELIRVLTAEVIPIGAVFLVGDDLLMTCVCAGAQQGLDGEERISAYSE